MGSSSCSTGGQWEACFFSSSQLSSVLGFGEVPWKFPVPVIYVYIFNFLYLCNIHLFLYIYMWVVGVAVLKCYETNSFRRRFGRFFVLVFFRRVWNFWWQRLEGTLVIGGCEFDLVLPKSTIERSKDLKFQGKGHTLFITKKCHNSNIFKLWLNMGRMSKWSK